jgi:predicted PurR-regulated permease PerM
MTVPIFSESLVAPLTIGGGRNRDREGEMDGHGAPDVKAVDAGGSSTSRLRNVLERRAGWIEALIVLVTIAAAFVVLGFLARYFQDYFRLILIFFFAWLLAFLISPAADVLQRRMTRLPRVIAVIAVIVPVVLVGALVIVRVIASLVDSFAQLAAALPDLTARPPAFLGDLQAWLDGQGVAIDIAGSLHSALSQVLQGMSDFAIPALGGAFSAVGTLVDSIIVLSLAIFMAVDRDGILRLGLEVTPPEKREDALMFRRSVGSAAAGFIRSQLILGALYGVWAFLVSVVFGLPFAPATAFLAGLIMAIPIYGPYVSWLPPVIVALLVRPEIALVVAIVMLVGWFIDENILAPLVRADSLQLHPIVVTFAFLLGAQLAGAIGAIVAIPLAAVVQAFAVKYFERYRTQRGWPATGTDAVAQPPPGGVAGTQTDQAS